jgi:ribosomal protein L7/L12
MAGTLACAERPQDDGCCLEAPVFVPCEGVMPTLTISEALAQIHTIDRHIARKQKLIEAYLFRDAALRDPLERDGGTAFLLARELQSIRALEERKILIRRAVQAANQRAVISHGTQTRSSADWLVWKREVVALRSRFLQQLRARIDQARREAGRHGGAVGSQRNVVVHLNEKDLNDDIEALEELQGYLAGQMSLKNATATVELPEETWQTGLEERLDELLARAGLPVAATGTCAVWLDGLADVSKKISVIKVIREITGMGLKEAKDLVEAAPRVVQQDLSRDEAEQVRRKLEENGGRATVC